MAVLIDRKELRDALYEADAVTMQGVKIINQFPAVNAVPVVRCEKCVLHGNCITEDTFVFARIENPFCCAGKRKEGAD